MNHKGSPLGEREKMGFDNDTCGSPKDEKRSNESFLFFRV